MQKNYYFLDINKTFPIIRIGIFFKICVCFLPRKIGRKDYS